MLAEHGVWPFVDLIPAHGFFDMTPMFLSSLVGIDGASGLTAGRHLLAVILTSVGFIVMCRSAPLVLSCIVWIALPKGFPILVAGTMFGLFFWPEVLRRTWAWLLVWAVGGLLLTFWHIAYGPPLVLASGAVLAVIWWQRQPSGNGAFVQCLVALGAFAGLLFLLPTTREMIIGMLGLLSEHAPINAVVHGRPLHMSLSPDRLPVGSNLNQLQFFKSAWLAVPILLFALTPWLRKKELCSEHWWIAVMVTSLYVVFMAPYAMGRIDPGISRAGFMSILMLMLVLPVIAGQLHGPGRLLVALIVTMSSAMVAPATAVTILPEKAAARSGADVSMRRPPTDGEALGLKRLGTGYFDAAHIQRLQKIDSDLKGLIREGEVFLDLTNRSALYYYLGYPVPIESFAFYNLPHPKQQARAVAQLENQTLGAAFIGPDVIAQDNLRADIKAHWLYRYLMENFWPIERDGYYYLVGRERATASGLAPVRDYGVLDAMLGQSDLGHQALSWGRSWKSIERSLGELGAVAIQAGRIVLTTEGRSRAYAGNEISVLRFDLDCSKPGPAILEWEPAPPGAHSISFRAATGTVVIPLDINPSWLLAPVVSEALLLLPTGCRHRDEVRLYSRLPPS